MEQFEFDLNQFIKESKTPAPEVLEDGTTIPPVTQTITQPAVEPSPAQEPVIDKVEESDLGTDSPKDEKPDVELEWDSFIEDKPIADAPSVPAEITKLSEALGLKGISTQDEFVSKIKELQKAAEAPSKSPFDGLDEDIRSKFEGAFEVAKSGGDYLAYLDVASVNYDEINPVELFEDEVAELFYDEKGELKEDEYYDYIDSIKPADKMLRGRQLQRELKLIQEQHKEQIKQKALYQKTEELKQIQASLNEIKEIANLPLKDSIKKQMFDDFASGRYVEKMFNGKDGKKDWRKIAETYFKAQYFDAIQKYNDHKIKSGTKRQVLNDLTNSTVTPSARPDNPTTPPKKASGIDLYLEKLNK